MYPTPSLNLLTLYQYTDGAIMQSFHLPPLNSPEQPGKDFPALFANELLSQTAELGLAYPDLDIMSALLNSWSSLRVDDWQRMWKAMTAEYNPIHNFDRSEDYTDSRKTSDTGSDTLARTGSDSTSVGGSTTVSSRNSGTDRTEYSSGNTHSVAGFEVGLTDSEKDNGTGSNSTTLGSSNTTTTTPNETSTFKAGTTDTQTKDLHGTDDLTHKGHLYGNIGVTTTQSMIMDEVNMRKQLNIAQIIIDEFKARFCIMVY